jgi:hypothetical protein
VIVKHPLREAFAFLLWRCSALAVSFSGRVLQCMVKRHKVVVAKMELADGDGSVGLCTLI